jgi:hypothetical protein
MHNKPCRTSSAGIDPNRGNTGSTAVEMLISTTVMSMIALAFMSLLLVNFKTAAKVDNMHDTLNAVRTLKERIGRDVRGGRALGDVYGLDQFDSRTQQYFVTGSDFFPASHDPVYGATAPAAPLGWPAPPYRLDNQTLIVQLPICDDHQDANGEHHVNPNGQGWPTMIPAGSGNPVTATNQDNVETHVYRIMPDPSNDGEFIMQCASFGGFAVAGYDPAAHTTGPQTILTGIIGPLDANGQPKVFQFVDKTDSNGAPQDSILPNPSYSPNYTGVVVNLEVRKHTDMSKTRKDISLTPIGVKMEVFLRNNALATSTGQPVNLHP